MRIFVMAFAVCCVIIPVNGQTSGTNPDAHRKHSADAQPPNGKGYPPSTVNTDTVNVNKLNVPQQAQAAGKPDKDSEKPPSYLYRLVAPETLPNTILCLIGIAGVFAAFYTLRAMKQQADIQATSMRQWVVIENWKAVPYVPAGGALSLHVQFDVVNATDLPLTLNSVFVTFSCHGCADQGGKIGRQNLVPPGKGHPVVTSLKLTDEHLLKWEDRKELAFLVNGSVEFEDVLKEVRNQPFSGLIGCSKGGGVRFIPPYGAGLYIPDT